MDCITTIVWATITVLALIAIGAGVLIWALNDAPLDDLFGDDIRDDL